jgi:hypothetical protein
MLGREEQVIIKDSEGSGNILISGNILSFAGANGQNHKKIIDQKRRCPDRNRRAYDYERKKKVLHA